MRRILFALAATAALGLSFPGSVTTAEAKKGHGWGHHHKAKVHHNRGRHLGWYKHRAHYRGANVVVIRR